MNSLVTTVITLTLSFGQVVALNQALYCLRLVFVYLAVIKLRLQHPSLPRPFAIPFGTRGTILFLIPPIIFSLIVAGCSATQSLGVGIAVVGFVVVGYGVSYLYIRLYKPDGFQGSILRLAEGSQTDDDGTSSAGEDDPR